MPTPRARREWANRVAAEYRSAALTAQVVHQAIQVGLPNELIAVGLRIVKDELDHADLAHGCLQALGGDDEPIPVSIGSLSTPDSPDGVLASLVDNLLRHFCIGETLAVPLFAEMRAGTAHPAARQVLDRVLRDEAVHRAFGWDALDALIELDPDGVRARVAARLPDFLEGYAASYVSDAQVQPLTDDERAAGLLPLEAYRRIFDETLREIDRRLDRRGIALRSGAEEGRGGAGIRP